MLDKPNCYARNCIHFTGVIQDDDEDGNPIEATERPAEHFRTAYHRNCLRKQSASQALSWRQWYSVRGGERRSKRANPRLNNAGFNVPFWAIWCSSPHW